MYLLHENTFHKILEALVSETLIVGEWPFVQKFMLIWRFGNSQNLLTNEQNMQGWRVIIPLLRIQAEVYSQSLDPYESSIFV